MGGGKGQSPGAPGVARTPSKETDTKGSAPETKWTLGNHIPEQNDSSLSGRPSAANSFLVREGVQASLTSHAGASAGLLLYRFCVYSHRHSGKKRILVLPCSESTTSLQMLPASGSHGLSVSSSLMVPEPFGEEV